MPDFECPVARVIQGQPQSIPGIFRIQGRQLQWSPRDSSQGQSFKVALEAITGALQKAKSKPQMRVATISGPLMLEFESMEARDNAIARITPLLAGSSSSSRSISSIEPTGPQANVKKQLLEEDRDLKSLYEEIVKTGLVSDADFWRSRQDLVMRKAGSAGGKQQVVGLSSALLAQIQPGNDGKGKQMTMTITPQFIQQVFAEKPHVHRAFVENVPQKLDEKEFWTRFAKHEIQIQARNRSAAKRSHEPLDPLFSKLVPNEAATLDNRSIDPTVNLSVDRFDNSAGASAVDNTFSHGGGERIARDMNRHSAVVLQGPGIFGRQAGGGGGPPAAAAEDGSLTGPEQSEWQKRGRSGLEDLREDKAADTEGLHIQDPRRYFERTAAATHAANGHQSSPPSQQEIVDSITSSGDQFYMDGLAADQVLADMQAESTSTLPDTWVTNMTASPLIPQLQSMLRQAALVCNELLRHFWSCLPVKASAAREKRATKLKETLDAKFTQLEQMQSAAQPADRQIVAQFLRPVKQAIDAALEAYEVEMQPQKRQ